MLTMTRPLPTSILASVALMISFSPTSKNTLPTGCNIKHLHLCRLLYLIPTNPCITLGGILMLYITVTCGVLRDWPCRHNLQHGRCSPCLSTRSPRAYRMLRSRLLASNVIADI
ncbi:hypothetical protein C8F01DRAFT_599251 [Mycena amicta]|nr:hypothetical protein C8F01DRAFT_599251 [Mycena amicta]